MRGSLTTESLPFICSSYSSFSFLSPFLSILYFLFLSYFSFFLLSSPLYSHHQLHVASARGLCASKRDLLRQISRRHNCGRKEEGRGRKSDERGEALNCCYLSMHSSILFLYSLAFLSFIFIFISSLLHLLFFLLFSLFLLLFLSIFSLLPLLPALLTILLFPLVSFFCSLTLLRKRNTIVFQENNAQASSYHRIVIDH